MMHIAHNRQLVANEAARLLFEEGYNDYSLAKKKAAQRLGCATDKSNQPTNQEIHQALLHRCKVESTQKEQLHLMEAREVAIEAMEFLQPYSPMLVGAVMDGTAGKHTPVTLHLFASTAEEVMFFMGDNEIPFQTDEKRVQIRGQHINYPLLRFFADDFEIELVVFEESAPAPVSAITGKAMLRLTIAAVKKLLGNS